MLLLVRWLLANSSPVCFGAKDNQFGTFFTPRGGKLAAVKLIPVYGYVTCDTGHLSYWSYWGCGAYNSDKINFVITTTQNIVILPPNELIVDHGAKWSKIPGYTSVSHELILRFFGPRSVLQREELRLWYGEDLMNAGQNDNGGKVCCNVYTLFTV